MSQITPTTVAIVMGTYNGARFLEEQLASIAAQTHSDWRLFIRDDGSTDETPALLERAAAADARIEIVQDTLGNLGPALNFSALSEIAKQRGFAYLLFADQDDVWHPDKVGRSLAALQEEEARTGHEAPLLVHSDLVVVDENRTLIENSLMRYKHTHHVAADPLRTLLIQNFVTGCSAACNRALLEVASPVPSAAIMHDYWFALCAATFGRLLYLPEPTLEYRQHQHNQIGTRRHTRIPNIGGHGLARAWHNGMALLERRITQAQSLHALAEQNGAANAEAQASLRDFLSIFIPRSRLRRLARAYLSHIRCQRGPAYNLLIFIQILCVRPVYIS